MNKFVFVTIFFVGLGSGIHTRRRYKGVMLRGCGIPSKRYDTGGFWTDDDFSGSIYGVRDTPRIQEMNRRTESGCKDVQHLETHRNDIFLRYQDIKASLMFLQTLRYCYLLTKLNHQS